MACRSLVPETKLHYAFRSLSKLMNLTKGFLARAALMSLIILMEAWRWSIVSWLPRAENNMTGDLSHCVNLVKCILCRTVTEYWCFFKFNYGLIRQPRAVWPRPMDQKHKRSRWRQKETVPLRILWSMSSGGRLKVNDNDNDLSFERFFANLIVAINRQLKHPEINMS